MKITNITQLKKMLGEQFIPFTKSIEELSNALTKANNLSIEELNVKEDLFSNIPTFHNLEMLDERWMGVYLGDFRCDLGFDKNGDWKVIPNTFTVYKDNKIENFNLSSFSTKESWFTLLHKEFNNWPVLEDCNPKNQDPQKIVLLQNEWISFLELKETLKTTKDPEIIKNKLKELRSRFVFNGKYMSSDDNTSELVVDLYGYVLNFELSETKEGYNLNEQSFTGRFWQSPEELMLGANCKEFLAMNHHQKQIH